MLRRRRAKGARGGENEGGERRTKKETISTPSFRGFQCCAKTVVTKCRTHCIGMTPDEAGLGPEPQNFQVFLF